MPTNTKYDPKNVAEYEKQNLLKNAKGFKATVAAGQTANLDFTLTEDLLLSQGSCLFVKDSAWGDYVSFQVLMGSTVVNQFVENWYINPGSIQQVVPDSNYPAKILAGLTLRLIYVSTGQTDVQVAINYNFEKVLV